MPFRILFWCGADAAACIQPRCAVCWARAAQHVWGPQRSIRHNALIIGAAELSAAAAP